MSISKKTKFPERQESWGRGFPTGRLRVPEPELTEQEMKARIRERIKQIEEKVRKRLCEGRNQEKGKNIRSLRELLREEENEELPESDSKEDVKQNEKKSSQMTAEEREEFKKKLEELLASLPPPDNTIKYKKWSVSFSEVDKK